MLLGYPCSPLLRPPRHLHVPSYGPPVLTSATFSSVICVPWWLCDCLRSCATRLIHYSRMWRQFLPRRHLVFPPPWRLSPSPHFHPCPLQESRSSSWRFQLCGKPRWAPKRCSRLHAHGHLAPGRWRHHCHD